MSTIPRGVRNNNPGNIMDFGINWQGLADPRKDDDGYCRFVDPVYGIRAMVMDIRNDWSEDGLRTVAALVAEFAPKAHAGNPTEIYARHVAKAMGVGVNDEIDLNEFATVKAMVLAMMRFELGMEPPYTDAQINKALMLAGVERPVKSAGKSNTVRSAGGVAAAGGAGAIIEAVNDTVTPLAPWLEYAPYVIGALMLGLAGFIIYERIKKMREGVA